MRQPSRVGGVCCVIQIQQMLMLKLLVRVVVKRGRRALSLSAPSDSLTLAAVGRTFPHDVESHALRRWILTIFVLLAHAQAQAARHFSPKPSQPFNLRRHRIGLARSQPQAFKPA